jgi:tRNA threonylcarbamoyladenosine biosynthesis protein TsaB
VAVSAGRGEGEDIERRDDPEVRTKEKGKRKKQQATSRGSITLLIRASGGTVLLILALDTTTRAGSVAVLRDDTVVACVTGDAAMTHGERLPGDLATALVSAEARIDDVDLLAVAAGPGSFTGLRVGIAAMQGLAFARGLRLVPVPTLEGLARAGAPAMAGEPWLGAWLDAERGEVFAALYRRDGWALAAPPTCRPPADVLDAWRPLLGASAVVFIGNGAIRHAPSIRGALVGQARVVDTVPPLAPALARIAAERPDRAVLPHAVVPIYIRRPDAELTRERHAGTHQPSGAP